MFINYFHLFIFCLQKVRKVQIGDLPRIQAPSPGSNPGFVDVSLSPFFISKHLLLWLCVTVSYNLFFLFCFLIFFSFFFRFVPAPRPNTMKFECRIMVKTRDKNYRIIQLRNVIMNLKGRQRVVSSKFTWLQFSQPIRAREKHYPPLTGS